MSGGEIEGRAPAPLPVVGLHPENARDSWRDGAPVAALVFCRSLVQAGTTAAVEALRTALTVKGLNVLPLYVNGPQDPLSAGMVEALFAQSPPDVIVNASSLPDAGEPFAADCPVLQLALAGDDAVNVALSEPGLVEFVVALAARWAGLRRKATGERRVAIVLANDPGRNSRRGSGVGPDTSAAAVVALRALAGAGYRVDDMPVDGAALMALLQQCATDDLQQETLPLPDYYAWFHSLPQALRDQINGRRGGPERDPHFRKGELHCGEFAISARRFGNVTVAVRPALGHAIDPAAGDDAVEVVPPHRYFAFYAWLQDGFRADAVVHLGGRGTLEWLPGDVLALSAECWPQAARGPMPDLYSFLGVEYRDGLAHK